MIERHPVTDRESWLQLRKRDVTASAVAALFGLHPFVSARRLHMEKAGVEFDEPASEMLDWRLMLEPVVAAAVEKQRPGWKIVKANEYIRDPDLRLGCTIDFYIEGDPRGLGVLQAKTAAPSSFRKHWADDQVPFYVALQNAAEMQLEYEAAFGAVACLIIDPWKCECPIYDIPRHDGVEQRIRDGVVKFWADIAAGIEPDPDFARDADLIAALYPSAVPLKTIDLTGDNMLPVLLAERAEIKRRMGFDAARCQEIETEVKFKMGDAEAATCGEFSITLKNQHRKAYSVAETSFRRLLITDHRPKQEIAADDERPF
jgi:predicted phage-related endonuclease